MTLHDQMRNDLLNQKVQIESRGHLKGRDLKLDLGTFVVKKGDKYYSNGTFNFEDPDEMDYRSASELAFKNNGAAFRSEVYWGHKYNTILQALANL